MTYKYNKESKEIVEILSAKTLSVFENAIPKRYKVLEPVPLDWEDKELIEGKDFELKYQFDSLEGWILYCFPMDKEPVESVVNVFTEEDLDNCWPYYKSYLIDILNGETSAENARQDLRSLIGTKYDNRTKKITNE